MAIKNTSHESATQALYRTYHNPAQSDPLSTTLFEALAVVEGVAPENLPIRLYDHIDVDAIDALFNAANPDTQWQLTLTINRYTVTAHADGEIVVESNDD
jgi:hypothetical protein